VLSGRGPRTLAGSGQVLFGGGAGSSIDQVLAPGQALTVAAGVSVATTASGGGTLGSAGQPLTVLGTVSARTGDQGIHLTGSAVHNAGTLQVAGGDLQITNLADNPGGISASGGSLTLDGAWSNSGTITMQG